MDIVQNNNFSKHQVFFSNLGKPLKEINEEELIDESEVDAILEEDIRKLSRIDENDYNLITKVGDELKKYFPKNQHPKRAKRFMEIESLGQMRILNPFLFANQVNDGAVLRRVALSPKAFSAQILTPDFGLVSASIIYLFI